MTRPQEGFTWLVGFANGTEFHEFAGPGSVGASFAEARQQAQAQNTVIKSLELISLVLVGWSMGRVDVPPGQVPVCFRRRQIMYAAAPVTPEGGGAIQEQGRTTVHCIGWKVSEDSQQGVFLFVFEDGSVFLTTNFQAI